MLVPQVQLKYLPVFPVFDIIELGIHVACFLLSLNYHLVIVQSGYICVFTA